MKEQIVSETLAAEATVAEVARRHELDRSLVYRWRREFGVAEHSGETTMFLPVEVSDERTASGQRPSEGAMGRTAVPGSGLIEIDLGRGRCVRVGADFATDALSRVLDVLERRPVRRSAGEAR